MTDSRESFHAASMKAYETFMKVDRFPWKQREIASVEVEDETSTEVRRVSMEGRF